MHFKEVANITVDSSSIIPQKKKNGSKKDRQDNSYDEIVENKGIEENPIKNVDQN